MIVSIVGIGLIGGSLALALKKAKLVDSVIGVDAEDTHLKKAKELDLIDEAMLLEEAIERSDVIILAVPVDAITSLSTEVLDRIDNQVVFDVGSTKALIMETISNHPKRGRYVGTHPMAGTEYSGPEAAIEDLYRNKCAVLVDVEKSDPDALKTVQSIYENIGMYLVYHESHAHDIHTAYVSHISHISSFALALTVLEKEKNEKRIFELAGGGFDSTVRLANSNPKTWIPIFEQNRDYVLDVLDEHINVISQFRTLLIKKDFDSFYQLIEQANKIKKIVN
ncbi:MAG: prephenate dehydrogenase [Saprospiraceae bacterium]|nr:prephenate dehydrogenase [Saprospiraceae bacterium]